MDAERLAYIVKLNDQEELSRDDVAALIDEVKRQDTLLAWIDESPECRAALFRALQTENAKMRLAFHRIVCLEDSEAGEPLDDAISIARKALE